MTQDEVEELVKKLVALDITPEQFTERVKKLTDVAIVTAPLVMMPALGMTPPPILTPGLVVAPPFGFEDDAMTRAEIRSQARIARSI